MKNIVGGFILWFIYLGTAWLWAHFNPDVSFDRGMMIVALGALAQLRWHQPDSGSKQQGEQR